VQKLIIEVALNENLTKEDHPKVPITPDEVAQDAYDCANAGASIVHIHGRDPVTGEHRPGDAELYAEAMEKIRAKCDVMVYPTQSYRSDDDAVNPHIRALAANPAAPLELAFQFVNSSGWGTTRTGQMGRSVAGDTLTDSGDPKDPHALLRFCRETGVKPKFVVYELGSLQHLVACRDAGLIEDPLTCHLRVHDRSTFGPSPDARGLFSFLDVVRPDVPFEWFVHPLDLADQTLHFRLNALAVAAGGHARTGLGDQLLCFGVPESNAQMVTRVVTMARLTGREVASPAEAREILGVRRRVATPVAGIQSAY
jgi:3-keto-5-aminohexanoate cleavage enzyme